MSPDAEAVLHHVLLTTLRLLSIAPSRVHWFLQHSIQRPGNGSCIFMSKEETCTHLWYIHTFVLIFILEQISFMKRATINSQKNFYKLGICWEILYLVNCGVMIPVLFFFNIHISYNSSPQFSQRIPDSRN